MTAIQLRQPHGAEGGQQRLQISTGSGLFSAEIFVVPLRWSVLGEHCLNT